MPKKLSDITHQYERSSADLEQAQDELTSHTETLRAAVERTSKAHRAIADDLRAYLKEHQDEVVIANDYGYHYDPSQPGCIKRRPVFWAHHVWVEDRVDVQPATYRVPADPSPEMIAAFNHGYQMSKLATAWGDVEPNGEPIIIGTRKEVAQDREGNTGVYQSPTADDD